MSVLRRRAWWAPREANLIAESSPRSILAPVIRTMFPAKDVFGFSGGCHADHQDMGMPSGWGFTIITVCKYENVEGKELKLDIGTKKNCELDLRNNM